MNFCSFRLLRESSLELAQFVKEGEFRWNCIVRDRKCRTCSYPLFLHCCSYSPRWPLAFLIFSPPLQNFMLFLQQKMSPFFFLTRYSSFSRWASVACRLTFSFSIFQICGHDNQSKLNTLDNRIQKHFPLYVFDSLAVSASQDKKNNLTFSTGLHDVGVRTVGVRTLRHDQIFSDG